jgi:hypothetical protein
LKSRATKSPSFGGMLDTHALCCAETEIAAQHRTAVSATPRKILKRIFNASIDSLRKNQKV